MQIAYHVRMAMTVSDLGDQNTGGAIPVEDVILELRYRDRPEAYLGSHLRKLCVLTLDDVPGLFEGYDAGKVSTRELEALAQLDAIISGILHRAGSPTMQVLVALEVSATIDEHDIVRAAEGAAILRRLGFTVVAAAGGNAICPEDRLRARDNEVAVLIGGEIFGWPDDLAAA